MGGLGGLNDWKTCVLEIRDGRRGGMLLPAWPAPEEVTLLRGIALC